MVYKNLGTPLGSIEIIPNHAYTFSNETMTTNTTSHTPEKNSSSLNKRLFFFKKQGVSKVTNIQTDRLVTCRVTRY